MIDRILRRLRRYFYYVSRRALNYASQLSGQSISRRDTLECPRRRPRILFAFPESDSYIFDLFWGRLLSMLSDTAHIDILRLPHISSGHNLSDLQCELIVSDYDAMHSFIRNEFEAMAISSCPGITLHSIHNLLDQDLLARLHRDISSMSAPLLLGYRWRDVNLGSFLSTDLSLCRKSDTVDSPQDLNFLRLTLYFAITACIAFLRLHAIHPYNRIALNNRYTFNLSLKSLADSLNVRVVNFWSRSNDPGHVGIYTNLKSDIFLRRALSASPASFASIAVALDFCLRYLRQKLVKRNSSQIYSPRGDKGLRLKILPPHTRYIAYFTSSPDELRSSDSILSLEPLFLKDSVSLFETECDVIRHLAGFCANEGLVFVIRLHPRLGREERSDFRHESSALEVFASLQLELAHLSHVLFIQPESPICSYCLGRDSLANVFWWSTIGIELAMLGAPCMPALADHPSGLGIRYHCFADQFPRTIDAWDTHLSMLIAKPFDDRSFALQACLDFYFSIGFGFVDLSRVEPSHLLAFFLLGSSIQEPRATAWNRRDESDVFVGLDQLFECLSG